MSDIEPTFACDAMLGGLARWLCAAGYDACWTEGIDDWDLVRQAQREGRLLLSSDTGIFRIGVVRDGDVQALFVPHGLNKSQQLAFVLKELGLRPRTPRCMACGGALIEVPPEQAQSASRRAPSPGCSSSSNVSAVAGSSGPARTGSASPIRCAKPPTSADAPAPPLHRTGFPASAHTGPSCASAIPRRSARRPPADTRPAVLVRSTTNRRSAPRPARRQRRATSASTTSAGSSADQRSACSTSHSINIRASGSPNPRVSPSLSTIWLSTPIAGILPLPARDCERGTSPESRRSRSFA